MKTIFRTLALATGLMLTACALLRPLGADDEARRAARITLTAYEALQQAILIYGGLPTCDAEAQLVRLCKERALWRHIKIVEATATRTIANATPVLNGQRIDAGQLVAAALAIEQVKNCRHQRERQTEGDVAMSVTSVLALLTELIANLPAAITTGQQVIDLVNRAYESMTTSFGDRDVSPEEISVLVAQIIANSVAIQALD